jgi:hypothetical protein
MVASSRHECRIVNEESYDIQMRRKICALVVSGPKKADGHQSDMRIIVPGSEAAIGRPCVDTPVLV